MMDITLFGSCVSSLIEAISFLLDGFTWSFCSWSCTSPLMMDITLFSSCVSSLIEAISLLLEIYFGSFVVGHVVVYSLSLINLTQH